MNIKTKIASLLLCLNTCILSAQSWTLEQCIEYAQENNITVQQRTLQTEENEIQLNTLVNSQLPSLSANTGSNIYFGRSPSRDGTYQDVTQLSGSFGASSNAVLFRGLAIRSQIDAGQVNLQASLQDLENAKENVALNVTSLYLQVLLNKELVNTATNQLALSTEQVEKNRSKFENGKSPESELYESMALAANDEATLTQVKNNLTLSLLDLSQALNRETATDFDIVVPIYDLTVKAAMSQLMTIDELFNYANSNRPIIKAEQLRLESSKIGLVTAKSGYYPSVSLNAGYNNNVYHSYASDAFNESFGKQFSQNGNEYLALSIGIPIFSKFENRNQVKSAKLKVKSQELVLTETQRNLRKEIEQAYYNANAAHAKYMSSQKAFEAAKIAFSYQESKYEAGRSTTFDYNDAKTRMTKADSDMLQAKYEYIFRCKILDYYAGQPLSL